jgi:hypothetical protein
MLGVLDKELIKLGFLTGGGAHDVLQKPFPFTYNDWFEGVVQEINPRFYISDTDDVAYMEKETQPITEQTEDNLNPDVEVGDVVELIHMDDPWGVSPMTRGVVTGFESMGPMGEKILVKWIISSEEGKEEFRELPLIKDVDYWRIANPLTEHIVPTDDDTPSFDMERFGNVMVRAYFRKEGGWGRPTQNFVLYITPSGMVRGMNLGSSTSRGSIPFKEGDKVDLHDLIRFERESGFDLRMKGRIREEVINEQVSLSQDAQQKMTPAVWKIIKMAMKIGEGPYNQFQNALIRYFHLHESDGAFLWLLLTANADRLGISIQDVLKLNYNEIEVPELWENTIEFNDDYHEEDYEDDCDEGGGYGAESGEECECYEYEEIEVTRKEEDGEEYTEYVDCFGATDEELKENGYDDKWECQCEDWETMYYKRYHYPTRQAVLVTHQNIGDKFEKEIYDYTYHDIVNELNDYEGIVTDDDHYDDNYEEAESWDYFNDDEEGLIRDWDSETLDTEHMMYTINQNFYKESPLLEQKGEQLKMWPTGEFNYPVGHLDDEEIKHVEDSLPDQVVEMIFRQWDKKGIDFTILKMLGLDKGIQLLAVMLLKRYIQFTQTPLLTSYTFDCDDLASLFDTNHHDYEMGYIKEYLCGDESYWDPEDWYNYEWEDYMTDDIDENNWKTISEIFGGVSKSVAGDILTKNSSSEEVDQLIEKYDEEIDDIRSFIVWAHNDEAEWAIKHAMAEDITDKI